MNNNIGRDEYDVCEMEEALIFRNKTILARIISILSRLYSLSLRTHSYLFPDPLIIIYYGRIFPENNFHYRNHHI